MYLTFVDSEIGDRLPPVHGHTPPAFDATTAEVDDELFLVAAESGQHSLQAVERKCAGWEEERGDDDLPRGKEEILSYMDYLTKK
jgi:hypothetical protein